MSDGISPVERIPASEYFKVGTELLIPTKPIGGDRVDFRHFRCLWSVFYTKNTRLAIVTGTTTICMYMYA